LASRHIMGLWLNIFSIPRLPGGPRKIFDS